MFVDAGTYRAQALGLLRGFRDRLVDEVLINRFDCMWVLSRGAARRMATPFTEKQAFEDWVLEFALRRGVKLDAMSSSRGGDWGKLRWHAVLPPITPDSPLLSLRRHRFSDLTLQDFPGWADHAGPVIRALSYPGLVLCVGPTGSGKTSLLHALLRHYCSRERVLLLEALAEIPLLSDRWVRLVQSDRVPLDQILAEALRLRPDRFALGEIRKEEVGCLIQAASVGHGAVLSTMHASDSATAMARLRFLGADDDPCFGLLPITMILMDRGAPPTIRGVEISPCRKAT